MSMFIAVFVLTLVVFVSTKSFKNLRETWSFFAVPVGFVTVGITTLILSESLWIAIPAGVLVVTIMIVIMQRQSLTGTIERISLGDNAEVISVEDGSKRGQVAVETKRGDQVYVIAECLHSHGVLSVGSKVSIAGKRKSHVIVK